MAGGQQTALERMREFVSLKYSKPHHSQLYENQFELLCVDDDPVFQVSVLMSKFCLPPWNWQIGIQQVTIKGLLGSQGFKVVRALSGVEALKLMGTRDHLPDLVLLDVEMPSESGYQVQFTQIVISTRNLFLLSGISNRFVNKWGVNTLKDCQLLCLVVMTMRPVF